MAEPAGEMTAEPVRKWRSPIPRRWRARPRATLAYLVAVLAVVGLVVVAALYYQRTRAEQQVSADRDAALTAARQVVLNLVTIDPQSVDRTVQALQDSATGDFKPELTQQADSIRQVVSSSKVTSHGSVVESALSSSDSAAAVALAAVQATVTNSASPQGEQRQYRFRVSMRKTGNDWLVSNLEFVP